MSSLISRFPLLFSLFSRAKRVRKGEGEPGNEANII